MGQNELKLFNKKIKALYSYMLGKQTAAEFEAELEKSLNRDKLGIPFCFFISICNTKERAHVCHGAGATLEVAWADALENARTWLKNNAIEPRWVKVEVVYKAENKNLAKAVDSMFCSYNEFFRRGISLDNKFRHAFTEAELNGNRLLNYKEKCFDLRTLNKYLLQRDDDIKFGMPDELILFDCKQYFADDRDQFFTLYTEGLRCGRRITDELTPKTIMQLINSGTRYLGDQINEDGSFDYGYYPIFHKLIPGYNILRHTSTIWSLMCAAEINQNHDMYVKAMKAIDYMIANIARYDIGFSYLVETSKNEIKLGGNAVAIILLTQHMKLFNNDEYRDLCVDLGEGILRMFNPENGHFVHVLNYPDLSVKEETRTVYYDGEAAFALARLYSLTGDAKWLDAAKKVVDRFIEDNYTKYRDHWVAYAVNELTMHAPEEKYFEFGLRNVQENLEAIYNQKTPYHTYLELLTASFEMYYRIKTEGIAVKYLEQFDVAKFIETIFYRGHHMLNCYGYPEYVMYFKYPNRFRGSFFIRHDGYRTRIDDVQHFCGAYISMYKQYDKITSVYKEVTGKDIV